MGSLSEIPWPTRALAAERTCDVLKRRMRAIDAGEEKTLIQRQLESAQRRAAENDRRRALMELRSAELQRYSAKLEAEVAARTEQIRTILDHVSTGFLLIGADGVVQPGCSKSCHEIFGVDPVGKPLASLLGWSATRSAELLLGVEQVFDDLLPEEASTEQIPARARLHDRDLALSYSVVRHEGVVARILATIVDVTAQISAEREARRNQALVQILMAKDSFVMFVIDARHLLREAVDALAIDPDFVRRAVHTVKGNSSVFGLEDMVAVCHEVESSGAIDAAALGRVCDTLRSFLTDHEKVLGINPDPEVEAAEEYHVSRRALEELRDLALAHDADAVQRFVDSVRRRPVEQFVAPIRASVQRLTERLGKEVDLVVVGAEVTVDPARIGPVLRTIPHLVRNALDHGIEPPFERGEKPRRGRIELRFSDTPESWVLELGDDGRGVDPRRIGAIAVKRGLLTAEQAANLDLGQAFALLATHGFSTAETVTDISGRGVGLNAVIEAVSTAGGTIRLASSAGAWTRFHIEIPKHAPHAGC